MKLTAFTIATLALCSAGALADSSQVQEVRFSDCSGGGGTLALGASHLTCRKVAYFKNGEQRSRTFPKGLRAKLTTLEGGLAVGITNSDSRRTEISCTIPNFDIEKGLSEVVGGIGFGMGGGVGGDISRTWGRNGIVCVPSLAGGAIGGKIYLNLGWLRVPAQPQ